MKLKIFIFLLFLFVQNTYASQISECAATMNFMGRIFDKVGEVEKAENLRNGSKILGKVLVDNYGQKRATELITNEIKKIQSYSDKDELMNYLFNKLNKCHYLLNKK